MFQQLNQNDKKKHDIDKIIIFSEMCITRKTSIGEMLKVVLGPTLLSLVALP